MERSELNEQGRIEPWGWTDQDISEQIRVSWNRTVLRCGEGRPGHCGMRRTDQIRGRTDQREKEQDGTTVWDRSDRDITDQRSELEGAGWDHGMGQQARTLRDGPQRAMVQNY